jgi:acyl-coenzyme A synthetase/AMP-(fatty) acid ligase/3-hydroxymyristoyl/3-hydroxydecanoyl-(acyl carrier protein) dehydratase
MSEPLPLFRGFAPDDPLLCRPDAAPLAATRMLAAARALAMRLPDTPWIVNRCEDPARFALGCAAALVAGRTILLPPARADGVHAQLAARYPDAWALTDEADDMGAGARVLAVPDPFRHDGAAWPPPAIPAQHVAAVLFTSGSTGVPQAHAKSWSALVRGAATFGAALGPLPRDAVILGTVAAQHMFGLETTLLAPWQNGVPLAAARPLYPADLAAAADALDRAGRSVWLMTTPLHLRACHAGLAHPPAVARIVTSTMPLPQPLAKRVERDWRVRIDEIYGCTEGGMLASRRTAETAAFTPAPGLAFDLDAEGCAHVRGGQLDDVLVLGDRFDRAGNALLLRGRSADVVKIGGKRTSLAALDAALLALPGVCDGAFVLEQPDATRVAALVVSPAHDATSLRAALARHIDRAFLPRPLLFVAALPRDAQGKLAHAARVAALGAARAAAASPARRTHGAHESRETLETLETHGAPAPRPDRVLHASARVPASHPALPGHFPGRPLVPAVMLLEAVERLLRDHGLVLMKLRDARFTRPVAPDDPIAIRVELGERPRGRFTVSVDGTAAASGVFDWRMTS